MATSSALHRCYLRIALALFLCVAVGSEAALFGNKIQNDRLTLMPDKSRAEGEWQAGLDVLKGNRRHSGVNIEIHQDRSIWGFYLPTERAPRIEGKASEGSPVHFAIGAESGDLVFDGAVKGKTASGHYFFEPNKEYASEVGKLLNIELSNDELLKLAFARISLVYIRGVHEALPSVTLEEIVCLRNFGLDPDGIKAFVAAGFNKTEDLTRLRSFGVTPDYATKARAAGYGKTADEITRLRSHGVTAESFTQWKETGYSLSTEELIRLRNHGVQPDYAAAWKKAGFDLDPDGLVRARNYGVTTDFAAAVGSISPKPTIDEIIRMRQFGVNADYYRQIKESKPNYSAEEIVRLRQFGVPADYLRAVGGARSEFTAEQIVRLRQHGVPAEYITALNVPDRKPLDAEAIIDLRNRGVSAETARKLRE